MLKIQGMSPGVYQVGETVERREFVCGFFLQRFSALRVWCQGGTCGCKRHTCVGKRIGEVFIGLLLALLSCVIGLHICSPLALDGPGGVGTP